MAEVTPFYEELSALDAFFLYAERPEAPLHIGGVYVFEAESAVPGGRGALRISETLQERLHLVPRYRQKVRFRPFNLGHPVWVDDPDFDLSYHVRRAALPSPGDDEALREYAARVLSRRLDVNRPLWELYVVEGLSGGRVALINKVHHAMVDGISTLDIGTLLFDIDPEHRIVAPARPWRPRAEPDGRMLASDSLDGLRRLVSGNPFSLPFRVPRLAARAAEQALASPWSAMAAFATSVLRPGPQLFFNRLISPHRRIQHFAIPLSAAKEVKDVFACTVNDVVLAVVAEATHHWLLEREARPATAMRVFCPVSMRDQSQRYTLGNQVSGMVVELPLGPMPAVTRLARVTTATSELKRSGQAVGAKSLTTITSWAPATLHALGSRIASEPHFGLQSRVNMVVTNVPGPQVPFYVGGARMLEVWPFVPIYHFLGLNIALVSYYGQIHVGLNADRDVVPDLDRFAFHLRQAMEQYQSIAARLRRPAGPHAGAPAAEAPRKKRSASPSTRPRAARSARRHQR